MTEESSDLLANNAWDLVPRPHGAIIVTGNWVYHHKLSHDGSFQRYKARWVLCGFTQHPGLILMRPLIQWSSLPPFTQCSQHLHELGVKNAFLHGSLDETVYCVQPSSYIDSVHPDFVSRLK